MDTSAFREHASGLLVPEVISREREVWPRSDWATVERATKFLASRGVKVFYGCGHERCQDRPIQPLRNPDGTITLRCEHKDRLWSRQ